MARLRIALVVTIVAIEAAELALFARAFGREILGLLAVRLLLALVLAGFYLRGSAVARVVLGALRLMAFMVAFVMAVGLEGPTSVLLCAVAVVDGAVGAVLLRSRND